jgi:enoyl-CoA hydratase
MISNFQTLSFVEKDGLGFVTVNRPSKLNALNIEVLRELKQCTLELQHSGLRGLILTGEGEKAFIAGADIAEMRPMSPGEAKAFSELGQQVTTGIEALPFPSIAAVNGFALGGGFEMALACDFIFASKNAVFGLPEVKLGLIPGFGGTQRLGRIVGERRAKELIFSGRNIKSDEAHKLGIALEIFETKEELIAACEKWFQTTLQNSSAAIKEAKKSLADGGEKTLAEGLQVEASLFSNLFDTPDMKEGTAAFLEKRKAKFTEDKGK